jgi:ligand-binding SRPBCC domain-containing protein
MFRDIMRTGPFRHWEHTHKFIPENEHSSWLEDTVEYEFPLGKLGKLFGGAHPPPPSALVRMAPQSYRRTTRCQCCQHWPAFLKSVETR